MQLKFVEMPTKKIDVSKFEFIDHKFLRVVRYSTVPPHAVWAWVGEIESADGPGLARAARRQQQ